MRAILLTATAALLPAPALAQEADSETRHLAEELRDPVRQEQMAAMIEAMAGVFLEVPVAPLICAAAEMAGEDPDAIDPDATVGDLVGPEAADAPREMAQRLPQMMAAMAGAAVALEDMLPRLAEIGERAREAGSRARD
jgi:hypothetical protein